VSASLCYTLLLPLFPARANTRASNLLLTPPPGLSLTTRPAAAPRSPPVVAAVTPCPMLGRPSPRPRRLRAPGTATTSTPRSTRRSFLLLLNRLPLLILSDASQGTPEFVPGMHYNPQGPLGCLHLHSSPLRLSPVVSQHAGLLCVDSAVCALFPLNPPPPTPTSHFSPGFSPSAPPPYAFSSPEMQQQYASSRMPANLVPYTQPQHGI
jgi:hypothetical protein